MPYIDTEFMRIHIEVCICVIHAYAVHRYCIYANTYRDMYLCNICYVYANTYMDIYLCNICYIYANTYMDVYLCNTCVMHMLCNVYRCYIYTKICFCSGEVGRYFSLNVYVILSFGN